MARIILVLVITLGIPCADTYYQGDDEHYQEYRE